MEYYGVSTTLNDDNSIKSIAGSISQIKIANNISMRDLTNSITNVTTANNKLRQALLATQQLGAAMARTINNPAQTSMPTWNPTPKYGTSSCTKPRTQRPQTRASQWTRFQTRSPAANS